MSQVTYGLRKHLARPAVYDFFLRLAGVPRARDRWIREFLRPFPGARILDIGCGTAELLSHLPDDVDYTGFDMSPAYIESARRRHAGRGRFACARVEDFAADGNAEAGAYDLAMAFGVMHHLDDSEARQMLRGARRALKPGGRLVTIDPAYLPDQDRLSRFVAAHDRGRNVRTPEGYADLGRECFDEVRCTVLHRAIRIPTDHAVLELRA